MFGDMGGGGMDGRGGAFRGHAEVKQSWWLLKKPP